MFPKLHGFKLFYSFEIIHFLKHLCSISHKYMWFTELVENYKQYFSIEIASQNVTKPKLVLLPAQQASNQETSSWDKK